MTAQRIADPQPRQPIPPSEWEIREGAWAIVRHSRDLDGSGHARAVRWARARLGLEDRR